jgi:hypothetical protein
LSSPADEALAEEGEIAVTLAGGDAVQATLAGRDPTTDITLLRIDRTDLPPAPLHTTELPTGSLTLVVAAEDGRPIAERETRGNFDVFVRLANAVLKGSLVCRAIGYLNA